MSNSRVLSPLKGTLRKEADKCSIRVQRPKAMQGNCIQEWIVISGRNSLAGREALKLSGLELFTVHRIT